MTGKPAAWTFVLVLAGAFAACAEASGEIRGGGEEQDTKVPNAAPPVRSISS